MEEYIKRETIINILCEDCDKHSDENPFACSTCEDIKEIMKLPAAEVVPFKKSHWERQKDGTHFCINCGKSCLYDFYNREIRTHWCPYCGAFMKEDGLND